MKNKIDQAARLIVICSFFFCFPSKSILANGGGDSTNLIQNSSFETNNEPTLQYWVTDTSLAQAVQDAPPGGGKWSLQLVPGWIPQEGFARTYVSGQSGVGVYRLTFWSKSIHSWQGSVTIGQWTQMGWVQSKMIYCDSATWTQYSLTDTLSLQAGDTIGVHLSAGRAELAGGQVLFDLIDLEKIASVTKVDSKYNQFAAHFALNQNYPNPFNPSTSISFSLSSKSFASLKVYDLIGREVATIVSEELPAGSYSKRWNAAALPSGVYFYRLQAGEFVQVKKLLLLK